MTRLEIEAAKKANPNRPVYDELACREMINSCLTYHSIDWFWWKKTDFFGTSSYADPYVKALGIDRVKELVEEQMADFAHAVVTPDIYTDCEGVTYHSVRWADEIAI